MVSILKKEQMHEPPWPAILKPTMSLMEGRSVSAAQGVSLGCESLRKTSFLQKKKGRQFVIGLLKIIPGPEILKPTLSLTEGRFQQAEGDERCVSVWVMKAFESLHSYKKKGPPICQSVAQNHTRA